MSKSVFSDSDPAFANALVTQSVSLVVAIMAIAPPCLESSALAVGDYLLAYSQQ